MWTAGSQLDTKESSSVKLKFKEWEWDANSFCSNGQFFVRRQECSGIQQHRFFPMTYKKDLIISSLEFLQPQHLNNFVAASGLPSAFYFLLLTHGATWPQRLIVSVGRPNSPAGNPQPVSLSGHFWDILQASQRSLRNWAPTAYSGWPLRGFSLFCLILLTACLVLPEIISQINNLHPRPCLRLCFRGCLNWNISWCSHSRSYEYKPGCLVKRGSCHLIPAAGCYVDL